MGVSMRICPRHIVPIQLKNFTPVGTPIMSDMKPNHGLSTAPVVNMWWAQTLNASAPIANNDQTMAL